MRIASLLAATTEWVSAIGASDLLVARSHECDHPDRVRDIPVVTSSNVPEGPTRAIDQAVRSTLNRGLSLFDVDLEMLKRLRPNLILTQTRCDVCAISSAQLQALLGAVLDPAPMRRLRDLLRSASGVARGRPGSGA